MLVGVGTGRYAAMPFNGWPEEALDFYEGLEADNSKAYWTAHRASYEAAVLAPMTALTEELDFMTATRPLADWLRANVGSSALASARRR